MAAVGSVSLAQGQAEPVLAREALVALAQLMGTARFTAVAAVAHILRAKAAILSGAVVQSASFGVRL